MTLSSHSTMVRATRRRGLTASTSSQAAICKSSCQGSAYTPGVVVLLVKGSIKHFVVFSPRGKSVSALLYLAGIVASWPRLPLTAVSMNPSSHTHTRTLALTHARARAHTHTAPPSHHSRSPHSCCHGAHLSIGPQGRPHCSPLPESSGLVKHSACIT